MTPQFVVKINGMKVALLDHSGLHGREEIQLKNGIKLNLTIVDSTKTALKSQQHGVAFWVGGRLVGNPSWTYGNIQFMDGRFKIAKRYTLIVETNQLLDEVLPDWTGFQNSPKIHEVLTLLKPYVDKFLSTIMRDQVQELQNDIILEKRDDLETLSLAEQRDVSKLIEAITIKNPMIAPEFLRTTVEAAVNIQQAKNGRELLNRLTQMTPDGLDKLNELLKEWDIDDIVSVMSEIDKRILIVEAIRRVCDDKNTDELHTLHPLVLNARWLFGVEFDSSFFVSNSTLNTVVKKLFRGDEYNNTMINFPSKRPDIVCLKRFSFSAVCTDRVDQDAGEIMKPDQILIIELKRGGSQIEPKEVSQAEGYMRQIHKSGMLHKLATIKTFVVGASIGDVDCNRKTDSGELHVITYSHLVESADKKLFHLNNHLKQHYDAIADKSLVEKALKEPKQTRVIKDDDNA